MMRKSLVVVLGVAGLYISAQAAFAEQKQCERDFDKCLAQANDSKDDERCFKTRDTCVAKTPFKPGRSDKYPVTDKDGNPVDINGNRPPAGGGSRGSKPKPGAHRTVDGSIIMVTPEGKEWLWNGKYNTVIDVRKDLTVGTLTQSHSVMQGDPDAPVQLVNGHPIRVSDPRYQAERDAEAAKKKVVVHDHRHPQPAPPPPAAGKPTKFSTGQGAASGQAPSTTNPGSTANTGGPIVRDHRQGANGKGNVPPIFGVSNIDKKPPRNAQ
jgi:hypothetical protein